MAGTFADYLENKVLDHIVGKSAFTKPTVSVGLFFVMPNDAGAGGTEVATAGYARVLTAAADWNDAASGATANANALTFPQATANYGSQVVGFGLYDNTSGGNLLASGTLTTARTVSSGDTIRFAAGELDVTLD